MEWINEPEKKDKIEEKEQKKGQLKEEGEEDPKNLNEWSEWVNKKEQIYTKKSEKEQYSAPKSKWRK